MRATDLIIRPHTRAAHASLRASTSALPLVAALAACVGQATRPVPPHGDGPPPTVPGFEAPSAQEEVDPPALALPDAWTLADVEAVALAAHPSLAAASAELVALQSEAANAARRPNPNLSLEFEDVGGSGAFEGFDAAQITLGVSQTFELGGKRARRQEVAEAGVARGQWARVEARLSLLRDVRAAFYSALAARERLALAADDERLVDRIHAAVAERVDAGATARSEERRALVALSEARLTRMDAAQELDAARAQLAELVGAPVPAGGPVGDLSLLQGELDLSQLDARITTAPALQRSASALRELSALAALADAARSPDLDVGLGLRQYSDVDDHAFVISLGLPLRAFNSGADLAAAARARVVAERRRGEATRRALRAEVAALVARASAARATVELIEADVLPSVDGIVEALELGYREGKRSLVEVLDAQRMRGDARVRHLEARIAHHLARIEMETLLGTPTP
ncbi:MAG: TolC family protein [Planctomycetota bacterium]